MVSYVVHDEKPCTVVSYPGGVTCFLIKVKIGRGVVVASRGVGKRLFTKPISNIEMFVRKRHSGGKEISDD